MPLLGPLLLREAGYNIIHYLSMTIQFSTNGCVNINQASKRVSQHANTVSKPSQQATTARQAQQSKHSKHSSSSKQAGRQASKQASKLSKQRIQAINPSTANKAILHIAWSLLPHLPLWPVPVPVRPIAYDSAKIPCQPTSIQR